MILSRMLKVLSMFVALRLSKNSSVPTMGAAR
jgi:hypothetical protein